MQMLHKINWGTFKCALDLSMRFYKIWKNLQWCLLISVGYFFAFAKHLKCQVLGQTYFFIRCCKISRNWGTQASISEFSR